MISLEFHGEFWHHNTRVSGLSYGIIYVILCLAIFVQLRLVTDKRTDGQTNRRTMIANTVLHRSHGEMISVMAHFVSELCEALSH